MIEIVPPRQTVSIDCVSACSRSTPIFSITLYAAKSGRRPTSFCAIPALSVLVGLHAHRVDHGVAAAPVGQLAHRLGDVLVLLQVEDLHPVPARHLEPLRHEV